MRAAGPGLPLRPCSRGTALGGRWRPGKEASRRERAGWPARYEIRVNSVLDDRWSDWFGGLRISSDGTQTMIVGLLPDQPALHGVLTKIRDLGLCLISVRRIDPG